MAVSLLRVVCIALVVALATASPTPRGTFVSVEGALQPLLVGPAPVLAFTLQRQVPHIL